MRRPHTTRTPSSSRSCWSTSLARADEITQHGLAFTIYRHGVVAMARGLYEATENLARVEVSARIALFQVILRGGVAGIAANLLFPLTVSTTTHLDATPRDERPSSAPRSLSTVTITVTGTTVTGTQAEADFSARLPATRGAAGALLIDDVGRVLLVERVYEEVWPWGLPGGIIEAGESPLGACVREIREELSVAPVIEHLAAVDWVPARPPKTAGNMFVFTGWLPRSTSIRLDPAELSAWAWVAPVEIPRLLAPHTARRVGAALAARIGQRTVYLEDGYGPLRGHR